jgi:hypothetical protein
MAARFSQSTNSSYIYTLYRLTFQESPEEAAAKVHYCLMVDIEAGNYTGYVPKSSKSIVPVMAVAIGSKKRCEPCYEFLS